MRLILLIVLGLSLSLAARIYFFPAKDISQSLNQQITVTGILWDEPKHGQYAQRFKIDDVTISAPEYPEYRFGDRLQVTGMLEENTFVTKGGDEVTEELISSPKIVVLPKPFVMRMVTWMLNRIQTGITSALPADAAALLLGVTIGVRSEFSKELLDTFTVTGILHVVAASGSNVATLAAVVLYSLGKLLRRRVAIFFTIIIIGWYAVLAGFDPPIVRASLMALIALVAQAVGRQSYSLLALGMTIWVMLMFDPKLISSVGFQLSVSASAGIIVIKPLFDLLLRFPRFLQDDFSTTLAAQAASLPILLSAFGSFAPLSIVINLLVLWTVPVIMILGLISALGSVIHPILAIPFAYLSYPFLMYFLTVVRVFESFVMPLQIQNLGIFLTASYYLLLLSFIFFMRQKRYE